MRAFYLFLLSVCALVNAASILDRVPEGTTIEHHLERYDLYMSSKSKLEDYVAEQYNNLDIAQRNVIADIIEAMLEDFREVVINGNGEIPPLDPYIIDSLGPFDYASPGIEATGLIKNMRMEGLMWYVVDKVVVNPIRLALSLQITVPRLTITGSYDAKAKIRLLRHESGGDFRVFLNRVIIDFYVKLGTSIGNLLFLKELEIHLDIHDTFIKFEGMTGSTVLNALINSYIQSITQETIQNELANVSETLSLIMFDVVDAAIKDFMNK